MEDVQQALIAKVSGDPTHAGIAGGAHIYERGAAIDFETLFAAGAKVVTTIWCVTSVVDEETGLADETYQFDEWSMSSTDARRAAERLDNLIPWRQSLDGSGTLPALTTRRLANVVTAEAISPDQVEMDRPGGTLHHKVRSYRVQTYPS